MKILKIDSFIEKLNIDPIKINDLENIEITNLKSLLSTYDIVKLNNMLYMVFLNDDIRKYISKDEFIYATKNGLFFYREYKLNHYMTMDDYDEKLNNDIDTWSITDIWLHDRKIFNNNTFLNTWFIEEREPFSQNSLEKYINETNYKHIHLS